MNRKISVIICSLLLIITIMVLFGFKKYNLDLKEKSSVSFSASENKESESEGYTVNLTIETPVQNLSEAIKTTFNNTSSKYVLTQHNKTVPSSSSELKPPSQNATSKKADSSFITYKVEKADVLLTVNVPKEVEYGNKFTCVAEVKNNSDKTVKFTTPNFNDDAHEQIKISIQGQGYTFTDCDTYGQILMPALGTWEIAPHSVYRQSVTFLPGTAEGDFEKGIDNAKITYCPTGTYYGQAVFSWHSDPETDTYENDEQLITEFNIAIV